MNLIKKIVSAMLTLVMVFSMNMTVFAEGESTLTINTAAGHTYEVYQMLTGDVSSLTDGSGTLANVVAGENLNGTVAEFDAAIKDGDAYLADTALAAAASAMIKGTAVKTVEGDGKAKSVTVADGYYVVKDKYKDSGIDCSAYMVAVVGDTEMSPKTSTTDIDKNITDTDSNKALETGESKKTDTAAIGDVIHYESTSVVPVTEGYKYYYYVVSDTMSEGLTFNKDLEITIGETKLTAAEYTLNSSDRGFELVVKDMKQYTAGAAVVITYSATVNENAKIGTEPNTNTTKLTYSNNPSDTYDKDKKGDDKPGDDDVVGVTPEHTTKTYVTQVTLQKTDADTNTFIDALKGATFTLTGTGLNTVKVNTNTVFAAAAEGTYYKLKDGTYTETAPTEDTQSKYADTTTMYKTVTTVELSNEGGAASVNITATVDAEGKITFTGLNAGKYTLSETNVPEGYNKCDDIEFTISAAQTGADEYTGGAITWKCDNAKLNQANGVFDTTVVNQKGNTLPSTGGIGTTLFYAIGGLLVLAGGVLLVAKQRMAH